MIVLLAFGLMACGAEEAQDVSTEDEVVETGDSEQPTIAPEDEPETKVVRWGQVINGDILLKPRIYQ